MVQIPISSSLVVYKPDLHVLERTIFSLQRAAEFAKSFYNIKFELTLVDNSCDQAIRNSLSAWVDIHKPSLPDLMLNLLFAEGNLGYGRGNNLVINQATSDYHLVANPDLFVDADFLKEALTYMEANSDVGLLSPSVSDDNGERQFLCKRNPTLFIMFLRSFCPSWLGAFFQSTLENFEMRDHNYNEVIDGLQYPTGCCMFFRTKFLQQIQGFDPDYFLHYEDADIGRRMLKVARVVYVPSVKVVHKWARDTHNSWKMRFITVWSGLVYWRKWGGVFRCTVPTPKYFPNLEGIIEKNSPKTGIKVLVTGANGFVGKSLCEVLLKNGYEVRAAVRQLISPPSENIEYIAVGDIHEATNWSFALSGIDVIIHLASRVHVMHDDVRNSDAEFYRVNVAGTENLLLAAVQNGVKRFVYLSSIKVNGEVIEENQELTPSPQDPYAISKWKAEQVLHRIAQKTGIEVVAIRPSLVYGKGVKANFLDLMRWVDFGIPLPLGSIKNKRSLIYLGNLVDAIVLCATHPAAAGKTYLISDNEQVSTPQLIRNLAYALNRPSRVFPLPISLLRKFARLFGKSAEVERLTQSLVVDSSKIHNELGWQPPYTMAQGLKATADWYCESSKAKKFYLCNIS